ncbi:MAG: YheC/YheD family protein [Bacillota bacterium]|nr:YheC/YheD family protein [Bacillota bacterium]
MWVKFKIESNDQDIIFLPLSMKGRFIGPVSVSFGGKTIDAAVMYSEFFDLSEGNSYENPSIIGISDKLKEKLYIPEILTYRIVIDGSAISIGPVIGLLLGIHTHRYNPKHMKKYSDRFGIYEKVGGLIYAFSPKSVNWKKKIAYGLFYNTTTAEWEYGCFPLPEVIYRRDFHSSPKLVKKLIKFTSNKFFNSHRFTKFELYNYISKNSELIGYLPPTQLTQNFEQVKKFIDANTRIILKPVDLSRGRGICIIEKIDTVYKITDYRFKEPTVSTFKDAQSLENFFNINQSLFNKYLIQKYLSLARIGKSLFDIRVVMQKNKEKLWRCSGIECRVSSDDSHLTNISRGGYALRLDDALNKAFGSDYETIPDKINSFCAKFCEYMDLMGEHFSEFGIDIAVDTNKNLWLIEANVFPSFKGFKKIDRQTYLAIRYEPFLYALSLTKFGSLN